MATPVYVLTVDSFNDPSFYLVFDELEKAELAAKIYEEGISAMTEEEFAKLKTYAQGIEAETLKEYDEIGEVDNLGELNSEAYWSIKELNKFLKDNNYKIEEELDCMSV